LSSGRKKMINELFQRMLQLLLPTVEKYFLWSTETNDSIFNFSLNKGTRKTIHKQKDWNKIWGILSLTKEKKKKLIDVQQDLVQTSTKLKKDLKEFVNIKNEVIKNAIEISRIVNNKALQIFSTSKTLNTILWVNKVITFM
jgi:hypothetical protein